MESVPHGQASQRACFTQSLVDECVFYRGSTIFINYVDDGIALDMNGNAPDSFVQEL